MMHMHVNLIKSRKAWKIVKFLGNYQLKHTQKLRWPYKQREVTVQSALPHYGQLKLEQQASQQGERDGGSGALGVVAAFHQQQVVSLGWRQDADILLLLLRHLKCSQNALSEQKQKEQGSHDRQLGLLCCFLGLSNEEHSWTESYPAKIYSLNKCGNYTVYYSQQKQQQGSDLHKKCGLFM